jgi:hypothetical protein
MATASQKNIALSDLALKAVKYADEKMDIGSYNKLPNSYYGWPTRYLCVEESRQKVQKHLEDLEKLRARSNQKVGWADQLDESASWARLMGCGNCGEYSALAFVYLRDVLKVRPLDWMEYGNFTHAFVIIGRESGTAPNHDDEPFEYDAIGHWNDSIVMCDAYYGRVLDYSHIVLSLGRQRKFRLLHREG